MIMKRRYFVPPLLWWAFLSAYFQGGEGYECEAYGQEPEAYDDLRFRPAGKMEMVVDGGATEDAFAFSIFEVADLENDAEQFEHENAADNEEQNFVAGYKCAVAHCGTEGK
jgi:hypothetical protein